MIGSGSYTRDVFNQPLADFADYSNLKRLRQLYRMLDSLDQLAKMGDMTAFAIHCDLTMALQYTGLTNLQRESIQRAYMDGERIVDIAYEMGRDEVSVVDSINGGMKRIRRMLESGQLYNRDRAVQESTDGTSA